MKAVILEKPGVLSIADLPVPQPGEYQVLCELLYGATCSGTDLHLIDNTFPWPQKYPAILGHESIGRVVEVGPKVRSFKVGDLVTRVCTPPPPGGKIGVLWGGWAEFGIAGDAAAMKADGLAPDKWQGSLVNQLLPKGTDPAAATMVITWRETLSHLTRMGFAAGQSILIFGSGANAFSFVQHARNLGASRIVMIGSPSRAKIGQALGVDAYIDYHQADLPAAIANAHQGGFDAALDVFGKKGLMDLAVAAIKPNGTAALYGLQDYATLTLDLSKIFKPFKYTFSNYEESEVHEQVVAFMQAGKLRAEPFLDLKNPFLMEKIQAAYDYTRARKGLKALVKIKNS